MIIKEEKSDAPPKPISPQKRPKPQPVKRPSMNMSQGGPPMKMKAEVKNEPGGDFDGRVPPLHGYEDSLSQYSDSGQSSSGLPGNGQGNMSTDMSAAFMQNIQGGNNSAGFNDPGGQWTDQQQPYPT